MNRAAATPPDSLPGDVAGDYVTVAAGDQTFGLPIAQVHDVFVAGDLTPVPLAPREVAGLINLRGRVVTAIDLRLRLGLTAADGAGPRMAVGIDQDGASYGLLVDSVGEVIRLEAGSREPNPMHLDPTWAALSAGVHRLPDRLLVILDIDAVLDFGDAAPTSRPS